MNGDRPPPAPEDRHPEQEPDGRPESLHINGLLDGRVLDESELRQAVATLSGCGAGTFHLDIQGGRFSIVPTEPDQPAESFGPEAQQEFLAGLQAVADSAQPGSTELNLRCKLVYAAEVMETLFVVRGKAIEPVTRRRRRSEKDTAMQDPPQRPPLFGKNRREAIWLVAAGLLTCAFLAWQLGLIDRAFARPADQLVVDTGPFGDMLSIQTEFSWGNYVVTLRRGPGYPASASELAERKQDADDLVTRATYTLIETGGKLFVQLLDEDGRLLSEAARELRPLLEDKPTKTELPGRSSARRLRLALNAGK